MPLTERFRCRNAKMVYKCLSGYAPEYMRHIFIYVKDAHKRITRSSESDSLKINLEWKGSTQYNIMGRSVTLGVSKDYMEFVIVSVEFHKN